MTSRVRFALAWGDDAPRGRGAIARPLRSLVEEPFGALPAFVEERFDEVASTIELRRIVELLAVELDDAHHDLLVLGCEPCVAFEQPVDPFDEIQLLPE